MSASKNTEAVANQGEFTSRVPPSEPMTTKGHAMGTKVGNDAYQEFHAETHAPGTAPKENTYQPQTQHEVPGQAFNPHTTTHTEASDTLRGATSADVHTGFGHPGLGQTSNEGDRKHRSGLEGVGASAVDPIHSKRADVAHDQTAGRSDGQPSASERVPASAESVAAERS